MNPQRVAEDGDAVALLELEDLKPKRRCDVASWQLFIYIAGSDRAGASLDQGHKSANCSEGNFVKDVFLATGETASNFLCSRICFN